MPMVRHLNREALIKLPAVRGYSPPSRIIPLWIRSATA
jgi:hypothetical protein